MNDSRVVGGGAGHQMEVEEERLGREDLGSGSDLKMPRDRQKVRKNRMTIPCKALPTIELH